MATTTKVTVSLDDLALELAHGAADRAGLSLSAWLSAAARREAVRQGSGSSWGDVAAQADDDDHDRHANGDLSAAG